MKEYTKVRDTKCFCQGCIFNEKGKCTKDKIETEKRIDVFGNVIVECISIKFTYER